MIAAELLCRDSANILDLMNYILKARLPEAGFLLFMDRL